MVRLNRDQKYVMWHNHNYDIGLSINHPSLINSNTSVDFKSKLKACQNLQLWSVPIQLYLVMPSHQESRSKDTVMLVDRYRYLDLMPCSEVDLRLMGHPVSHPTLGPLYVCSVCTYPYSSTCSCFIVVYILTINHFHRQPSWNDQFRFFDEK